MNTKRPADSSTPSGSPPAPFEASEVTLDQQIACARRELALRKNVYPKWVGGKRMTQFKADDEIRYMTAIVKTLETLKLKPA